MAPSCSKYLCETPFDASRGVDVWVENCRGCCREPCHTTTGGAWKHSLFWCCADIGICLAWSLPYVNIVQGLHTFAKIDGTTCSTQLVPCCLSACSMTTCCYVIRMRAKTRAKYGIAGNTCIDILALMFCPCCAMIQLSNQVGAATPCSGSGVTEPPALQTMNDVARKGVDKTSKVTEKAGKVTNNKV